MTTISFQPSTSSAFTFQATLDGTQYNCVAAWNVFGRRYFLSIYDLSGNLILSRPIVGSPPKIQAVLTWADWTATATLSSPHNVPIGSVANIDVTDTGLGYDGSWRALSISADTLTYTLPGDPGQYGVTGNVAQDVNLIATAFNTTTGLSYFQTSTLIYRPSTGQFEIRP